MNIKETIKQLKKIKINEIQKIENLEKNIYEIFNLQEEIKEGLEKFNDLEIEHHVKKITQEKKFFAKKTPYFESPLLSISKLLQSRYKENKYRHYFSWVIQLTQNLKRIQNASNKKEFNSLKYNLTLLLKNPIYKKSFFSIKKSDQKTQTSSLSMVNEVTSNKVNKSFMIRDILKLEENKIPTNTQKFFNLSYKDNTSNECENIIISNKEDIKINLAIEEFLSCGNFEKLHDIYDKINKFNKLQNNLNETKVINIEKSQTDKNKFNQFPKRNEKIKNWLIYDEPTQKSNLDLDKKTLTKNKRKLI